MAGQADGSIIIDAEMDLKGFKANSAELRAAMKSFSATASKLQKQMQDLGMQKFATDEYKQVQQDIALAEKYLDQYNQKRAKLSEKGKVDTPEWKALIEDIKAASAELARLRTLKTQMEHSGTAYISGVDTAQYQSLNAALQTTKQNIAGVQKQLARLDRKQVFKRMAAGVKNAASHMARLVTQGRLMKRPLESMSFMLRRIAPSLLMTEGLFGLLRKAVNAFLQENEHLTEKLNACWTGIGNILGPIITRLIDLVATAVSYVTSFLGLLGFIGKSTTEAINGAGKAAEKQTDNLKGQLTSIDELNVLQADENSDSSSTGGVVAPEVTLPDWAKLIAENLKSGDWSSAARILAEQVNRMVRSIDWTRVGRTVSNVAICVLDALNTAIINIDWQALGNSIAAFIAAIDWSAVLAALATGIGAVLGGLAGLLFGLFELAFDSLTGMGQEYADEYGVSVAEGVLFGIMEALYNLGAWVVENVFNPFIDAFKAAFGINSPSTVMKEQGGFIIAGLLEGLKTTKDKWSSIGSNICAGIGNGISSGWSWLKKKVQNLASSLLSAAKSALGIHSPSKLFRDAVGLNIGYGVGEGIEAAEGSVLGSVAGVADAISKEFNANEYSVGGVVSNAEVDGALTAFSDKIAGSFAALMDRMQAIANSVSFTTPGVAQGRVVPYTAQTPKTGGTSSNSSTGSEKIVSDISEAIYAAVLAAMRQSENNGTQAVNVYLDGRQITAAVEKRQGERGMSMVNRRAYGYN